MQSRGRTLHTCSYHSLFSKLNFKIEFLGVQSITFERQNFDFESAFAMLFESIAKPQREAQKYHLEHTIATLSRRLQWFSKRAHKKYYKTAVFWGQGYPRPDPLDKNRGLENTCAPHPKESTILGKKGFKCERAGGTRYKPRDTERFSDVRPGTSHRGAAMTDSLDPNSLKL